MAAIVLVAVLALPVGMLLSGSASAGEKWTDQDSGTTAELEDVAAVDQMTAWAVGMDCTILKTRDGGETWETQESSECGYQGYLRAIGAVDADTAWVSGDVILKTTDGGETWVDPDRRHPDLPVRHRRGG